MKQVLETVAHIAPTDSTVFIHGESGTGKELMARAIHCASRRKDQPLRRRELRRPSRDAARKRAFRAREGRLHRRGQKLARAFSCRPTAGTLFLDEIGDMPLSIQAKLLRVLQERQFYPVGSEEPVQVDVRVIVATNKDLAEGVRNGIFRDDLYYRIHVIPISLPPLRSRKEDIPLLVAHFLEEARRRGNGQGRERAVARGHAAAALPRLARQRARAGKRHRVCRGHDPRRRDTRRNSSLLPRRPGRETGMLPLKQARDAFEKKLPGQAPGDHERYGQHRRGPCGQVPGRPLRSL